MKGKGGFVGFFAFASKFFDNLQSQESKYSTEKEDAHHPTEAPPGSVQIELITV